MFISTFSKIYFRNTIRVSNSLDPDQAQHFVGPDLGPNCLQRLSADETIRPIVKWIKLVGRFNQYLKITSDLNSPIKTLLAPNVPIPTKVVCFSRLLKCLRSLYGKQCGPQIRLLLFASILNLSVMLGNYLQQTTTADAIFRCIFFLAS